MSKKSIVNEIRDKLHKMNVNYHNLNITLSNGNKLCWVGHRQVLIAIRDKHYTNMFRAKRFPLYSKTIDINMLNLINNNL